MGNVIDLNPTYPYREQTMVVRTLPVTPDGPLYSPMPDSTWLAPEGMRWLAGVVELELGAAVQIRSNKRGTEYSLQLGDRPPITELTLTRVLDILGGCLGACDLLKHK